MKKLIIVIGVILAFLIVTNIQSFAQEDIIHGCYHTKNGRLRIVSDPSICKKRERSISWNQTGPQGEEGERGPEGPPGVGAIQVYDSSDSPQYLGILVELGHPYTDHECGIFIPSLGAIAFINVMIETDRFTKLGDIRLGDPIYFEGENCTGAAYMKGTTYIPNTICRVGDSDDNARYFLRDFPPTVDVPYSSWVDPRFGQCSNIAGVADRVCQVIEIPEENIPFNLPVTLPLSYEAKAP